MGVTVLFWTVPSRLLVLNFAERTLPGREQSKAGPAVDFRRLPLGEFRRELTRPVVMTRSSLDSCPLVSGISGLGCS